MPAASERAKPREVSSDPLRFGIIGVGVMGSNHARVLSELPGVKLVAIADPAHYPELTERWLPTAQRETPSIRAILVLDESRTVLAFASRAGGAWAEEEGFRRLLIERGVSPSYCQSARQACTAHQDLRFASPLGLTGFCHQS